MLFSSLIFIYFFLPIVLFLYYLSKEKYRNYILLVASLIFYAWGGVSYILIMISSIVINFLFALLIDKYKEETSKKKIILLLCVLSNLAILGYFKYANFLFEIINSISKKELMPKLSILLPIGISFYTFQALSYVVDVYRNNNKAEKNIFNLALYISFFPQLIAGPIVKYHDIASQIISRSVSNTKMAFGIKRFIYGLSKKVILANYFALAVDNILLYEPARLSTGLAWSVAILYTLQIYYDFSGYSDMAIGLGKMFGFSFLENFNYPYIASSIQDFWRRWHISLSTWFKEYVYIPLGGSRVTSIRIYLNLLIVFFATGLWHGASYNFVVWGLFHGFFLIIERLFLAKLLEKNKLKILNHIYVILVVVVGWVLFRADNLNHAISILKLMFNYQSSNLTVPLFVFPQAVVCGVIGILFSGILQSKIKKLKSSLFCEDRFFVVEIVGQFILLFICIMFLAGNTYNPFIYFRF